MEDGYLAQVYQKYPIAVEEGRGAKVWDVEGREYIDLMGGYGVAILGHCNPYVVDAIKRQAERLITCHGSLYNRVRAEFAEKLVKISPKGLDRVYLGNSGAEAVECAIKLARKATGRSGIVAMTGGYHGKTLGALSATWSQKYREPFQPLLPKVKFAAFGDAERVNEAVSEDTAAVIVEPIQGETGIHLPPDGFLKQTKEICSGKGSLLIFDEIQSGFGRTGRMWAGEHWGVNPDVMCVAKGIAGGLPLGATIARSELMSKLKVGEHTTTFGGSPLACAAGSAAIDYLVEHDLPGRAERVGGIFKKGLEELRGKHRIAREVRGLGLMLALELRFDVRGILLNALQHGVILLYSGKNTLRFLPPLVISEEEVQESLKVLDILLTEEEKVRAVAGV